MKINVFSKIIVVLCISGCLFACKSLQIQAPTETYLAPKKNTVVSEIPVNIGLDVRKIEQSLNKTLNGLLFEQDNVNNQDLSIKVWKAKPFQIKANNNAIEYTVPIKIWSRFVWKIEQFGLSVGDKYEANGTLNLKFRTIVSYDKHWNVVTRTQALGYDWIETPRINALGVRIPVAGIANAALNRSEKMISTEIDKYIARELKLKPVISKFWNSIQKPMQLNTEYDIWLRLQPQSIFATNLKTNGDFLSMQFGITSGVESFVGLKPNELAAVALPQLNIVDKPVEAFKMSVSTDVSFTSLSAIATKTLKDMVFEVGKRKIKITNLSIYGSNEKAVFVIDVVGAVNGRIYFNGKPVYNSAKRMLEIVEPEFDLQTKNALQKSASWLANGIILQKIKPYLSYAVDKDLDDLKQKTNDMLKDYKLYEGINIRAKIDTVDVADVDIVKAAFRLNSVLLGKVNVDIGQLAF